MTQLIKVLSYVPGPGTVALFIYPYDLYLYIKPVAQQTERDVLLDTGGQQLSGAFNPPSVELIRSHRA